MVLDSFRRFGATKAAKVMLFSLIVAFGAWGIEGFLQAQRSPHGITVNGEGISLISLEEDYKRQIGAIEQRLGQPLDAESRAGLNLAPQMVAQATARTVLRQAATALHLAPATRTLQTEIASLPPFLNEQGAFDTNRYRATLAQLGRTPAQFEAEMANDLAVRNLGQLVALAPLPAGLVAQQRAAQNQPVVLEIASVALAPFPEAPTDEELKKYYELNPKTYETPEHRTGEVLVLNTEALATNVVVPEARIAAEYEANKTAYSLPETRKVRHVLVSSLASATAIAAQVQSAADMARLANEHSIDPGNLKTKGGDLGFIKQADVVPAFGTMAFSLPVGKLSSPVQSPFGWHLIWVDEIKPAQTQTLADVRSAIEKQLRETEVANAAADLATQADELIAGGATLAEVGKKLGLKTEIIARTTAENEEVQPEYLAALFATAQGQTSAPISLPDGVAYVQTTRIEPATQPALESIKTMVARDWKALQAELLAQRQAESVLSAARAPATGERTLLEAARQANVAVAVQNVTLSETSTMPAWLRPRLSELRALSAGQVVPQVLREGQNWHIVRVASRGKIETVTSAAADVDLATQELRADMEALLVTYLQNKADIECNASGLKQVFGTDVACPNQ